MPFAPSSVRFNFLALEVDDEALIVQGLLRKTRNIPCSASYSNTSFGLSPLEVATKSLRKPLHS